MPPLPARVAAFLVFAAAGWTANDGKLITVEQRDPLRSARAPRTVDVSANGRYVAFASWARLAVADADDLPDIYVLDRDTGRVTLESDGLGDVENAQPRLSADGQRLVFDVRVVSAPEARVEVAFRDRAASTTRMLTGDPRGTQYDWSRHADISDDGQVVVFSSASSLLVPGGDANGRSEDVYSMQLATGAIARESVTSAGVQLAAGASYLPSISGDGRYVAFASTAPLDGEPPRRGEDVALYDVYVRDRAARTTIRISRTPRGARSAGDSTTPSISADGRYVAFSSDAGNIVQGDNNRGRDVFLVDLRTMTTTLVSRADGGGTASGVSLSPVISSDGRFVAFQSDAGNLICAARCRPTQSDINLIWDVFLFDRVGGTIVRVSEDELGGWMEWSAAPAIDGTGQVIAFSSRHPTDALDQRQDLDLFIRKR
jgi:Tol biopolymer transport system component